MTITATSQADSTATGTLGIDIVDITTDVSPASLSVGTGLTQQFTAVAVPDSEYAENPGQILDQNLGAELVEIELGDQSGRDRARNVDRDAPCPPASVPCATTAAAPASRATSI